MPLDYTILTANITVVAASAIDVDEFEIASLTSLFPMNSETSIEETQRGKRHWLSNLRLQAKVSVEAQRFALFDESGQHPADRYIEWFNKLSEITSVLDVEVDSFGYNFELEFSVNDQAGILLVSQIIQQDVFSKLNGRPTNAGARFQFAREDITHTLILEPRYFDPDAEKVFVKGNAHFEEQDIPNAEQLKDSVCGHFDQLTRDIENLLTSQGG